MKTTKKTYIAPSVCFEVIMDDTMTEIQWSGAQTEEGFAKHANYQFDDDEEYEEREPLTFDGYEIY